MVDAYHSNVRFDYAGPTAGKYKGTVLTQARVELSMNRKDASTRESSNKGDDRYSVRLIDGDDNEAGGRALNALYIGNRMLDGDPFYVKVT
ncbi:hypothetical protein [Streptomyces niger]|uniref:hypothetical protein n=1 Tax=Streptomyces niger TaxID=66373 RepID=UPI00069A5584|nr:hypothetical protein [Streptomyces niger]